jgi:hypothetical protein
MCEAAVWAKACVPLAVIFDSPPRQFFHGIVLCVFSHRFAAANSATDMAIVATNVLGWRLLGIDFERKTSNDHSRSITASP